MAANGVDHLVPQQAGHLEGKGRWWEESGGVLPRF